MVKDNKKLKRTIQALVVGFSGLLIVVIGGMIVMNNQSVEGSPSPGTCLPIDKGGTGCDEEELVRYFSNALYPVGSILTTTTGSNPGDYLGGTWEAYGSGRTLVGTDTTQTEFNTVEKTGGTKTHTLTAAEMPAHRHRVLQGWSNGGSGQDTLGYSTANQGARSYQANTGGSSQPTVENTGGGGAHNNLQPYITVYFWKRVS